MIPDGWEKKPVGEYLKILSGFPFQSEFFTSSDIDGFPVIRIRDLLDGKSDTHYCGVYDATYLVTKNDLLIGMDGEFHIVRWQGTESLLNQRICKVTSNDNAVLDTHFLYYFLQPHLLKMQHDIAATTVKHLSTKHLKSITAPIPPLPEQKRIAEVLCGVDEAIETTKSVIEQTKKVKQGLLQTLLTRGINHTKFKPSPLGEIPEGWSVVRVADIAGNEKYSIVDGPFGSNLKSEHYETHGIPVLQSGFVTSGKFKAGKYVYVSEALFKEQIRSKAVGDDILMAKIGAQAGRCAIIPSDHPISIIAGNCLKINVNKRICSNKFLWHFLTYEYENTGLRKIKTETAQPAISLKNLRSLKIPLPPLPEQEKMVEAFEGVDNQLTAETTKLASLQQLKKGLMHDLLTGKVRVA